ncbi:DNA primase [Tenacibaculum aiptasiae]|uniref:DNA primase n=1 Tax=Tenacibaculum aiptasiae TaxID=426481 RepID=A0A7J5AQA2_9FLAO|nr:DNA primase [Tenacibaculum aiptasiae]KAB1159799.1 DNA primase [Tenacibaculum aiptasiae]
MKTLKTTLLISMLILLTTSCTDLTKDDLVPETNNIEFVTITGGDGSIDGTHDGDDIGGGGDTGGDDGDGSDGDGGKGN